MYRLYKITLKLDGSENPQVDTFDDVIVAEGNFEFQKGLAMETNTLTFLMLIDDMGNIHKVNKDEYITLVGDGTFKPRLFEIKTTTEEKAKSYPHETENEVSADYYKRLGGAKQDANVKSIMLRGIGTYGRQLEYSYWTRPTVDEAEPQPTEGE